MSGSGSTRHHTGSQSVLQYCDYDISLLHLFTAESVEQVVFQQTSAAQTTVWASELVCPVSGSSSVQITLSAVKSHLQL